MLLNCIIVRNMYFFLGSVKEASSSVSADAVLKSDYRPRWQVVVVAVQCKALSVPSIESANHLPFAITFRIFCF